MVKFRRKDVFPEKVENSVFLHGFGKSQARGENGLRDVRSSIPIPVGDVTGQL